jgi:hypothetical protein
MKSPTPRLLNSFTGSSSSRIACCRILRAAAGCSAKLDITRA